MAQKHGSLEAGPARWIAALASALLAAGCAPDAPATHADAAHPTIVSLNPCLDAILVEVAAPDQVLALSHYSRDPGSSSIPAAVAARYGVTGGTAEEVMALRPDVVLASTFLPQPTRSALERAGLRVETFGSPKTVDESIAQVRAVAALAGDRANGESLVHAMAPPAEPPIGAEIATLLWQPGQIVPGETTLIAQQMKRAGLVSESAAMGLAQADYLSLEAILANPPRILLVAGDQAGQVHPLLGHMRSTMVARLDPSLLYCGGPTIPKLRSRLAEIRADYQRSFYQAPN